MEKPFSQACENNKGPILQNIRTEFAGCRSVWEIGSGTGQHACYFSSHLPHLSWHPTDKPENLAGIDCWVRESGLSNLHLSLALDVNDAVWPCQQVEALFTANTLHILHWPEVINFFAGLAKVLAEPACVCIYGPFNYRGEYTSASNKQFDKWLKARDPLSGIRDYAAIEALARDTGLTVTKDIAMPANNRLLVLRG